MSALVSTRSCFSLLVACTQALVHVLQQHLGDACESVLLTPLMSALQQVCNKHWQMLFNSV